MEKETPLKTLSREEETAVKNLAEIHNAISDGRLELDKVTIALQTAYKDRTDVEKQAMEDLYQDSLEILDRVKMNYDTITAMNAQAQQTFQTIKKLADVIEQATEIFELKTEKFIENHKNMHVENSNIKKRLDAQAKQLVEKERGLNAFNQEIIKRAAMVESKVEALKAIKK